MTEQQLASVMGKIATHQRALLDLSNDEGAWIEKHPKVAMELFKGAVLRRIREEKELKESLLDSQNAQVAQPKSKPSILELVSTVVVSATTSKFVAKDKFVVNTKRNAPVKISAVWDNFTNWFLKGDGKIEDPISEQTLRYHKLRKASVDDPVIAELGGEVKAETILTEMFSLMEMQKNGEDGVLLNNGYANIFYIRDQNGVLRAVCVYWFGDGWYVSADSALDPRRWDGGGRVFSCNSDLKSSEPSAPAQVPLGASAT